MRRFETDSISTKIGAGVFVASFDGMSMRTCLIPVLQVASTLPLEGKPSMIGHSLYPTFTGSPFDESTTHTLDRRVGAFAMCEASEISLGQAFPGNQVDLPFRADLSRRAASIRRVGEDHLFQPYQTATLNGDPIDRASLLTHQAIVGLGDRVRLQYIRPTKLSGTARLELLGNVRWQSLLNAAILLGESCLIGSDTHCHIVCPDWTTKVVLFRNNQQWFCRVAETANVEVDGKVVRAPFPLVVGQKIRGDEISMTLE